ncbi:MAG TPA: rod shape-determining protein [Solirubrobacteraceae bacterium]|nr:rod shape-determining protein [Solirubrobacteraceae bacterium]
MAGRLAVDVGSTTVVAAAQEAGSGAARPLVFEGEDGPPGTLAAALTWSSTGPGRAGIVADRMLDVDPLRGVRGPIAHLESGSSMLETQHGPVPVVAMVGELLARPLRLATRELGAPPGHVVLTTPPGWPPDGRRARALRAAAALAGMPAVTLLPSAIAAAELERADGQAAVVLVCDVGGRTCQVSLVDLREERARLVATTELVAGADLFDELLYLDVLRELAERDAEAARRLEDFHLHAGAPAAGADDGAWATCQAALARSIRHAREALTVAASHELEIGAPVGVTLVLEQSRVRDLVLTESQIIAAAAREQLARADLGATRSEHVRGMLVGGGALTPGLRDVLEAELALPVVLGDDPVTAVARGALEAAARDAPGGSRRADSRPPARTGRTAAIRQALRVVLEDVVVATLSGEHVIAVVRHESHHRVVRVDLRGRVEGAHGVSGEQITALTATPEVVVVSGPSSAALFTTALRPLTAIARPLLAAASGATAWVVAAGDEPATVLDLTTLAVGGRAARVAATDRLGLVPTGPAVRLPRRAARPVPPPAHGSVSGDELHLAVPVRGRGGQPAQLIGAAGPVGIDDSELRTSSPWVTDVAPSADGVVTVSGAGPVALSLGSELLSDWPAGVRVRLAAHGGQPWVVAALAERWEALRVEGAAIGKVRAGDGNVERAGADDDGLWLVCESSGERRLVCVSPDGSLERVAALGAPLEPLGRAGDEILTLAGPPGAPRMLVAITPG